MLLQILRQLGNRGEGVGNAGNRGVFQPEFLVSPGKLVVIHRRGLAQTVIESGAIGNQQGAHLTQPGVVLRQDFQHTGIFKVILEYPVFLIQNPVILRQCGIIIRPKLT